MGKKEEILLILQQQTAFFEPAINKEYFSAEYFSEKLELKRNTTSKYLNSYCITGELFKVLSRPVIFLHKKEFELHFFPVDKMSYDSISELFSYKNLVEKDLFSAVIGNDTSLNRAISELKTSVDYPKKGLPVLLMGASGTGKSYLAEITCSYAREKNIICEDAPFIVFNCAQYSNNPELLASNLFGYVKGAFTGADKTTKGAFEKGDGGYLFLDEVHRLRYEDQEKLFTYLDKGYIYRIGDPKTEIYPEVRLIFATTESQKDTFLTTFWRRVPLKINLPTLEERSLKEKGELLYSFLIE